MKTVAKCLTLVVIFLVGIGAAADAATRSIVRLKARESAGAPVVEEVVLYESSHALVIGIDDYRNGWPRLSNAVRDARLVAEALSEKGFTVDLETDLNADALERRLKEFFILKGSDPQARLFVWFAGHGHTEGGEGFLVPADAPRPRKGAAFRLKALSMRRFGEYMRLAESKHVFAVFDACFAGTVFTIQRGRPPEAVTRATTLPVRQFLTSGDAKQEVSDDGRFRRLFIRALNSEEPADANGDGYLTASELGMFLTDRMVNLTRQKQTPRYGKLRDENYDRGDFVFLLSSRRDPRPESPPVPPPPVADPEDLSFGDIWQEAEKRRQAEEGWRKWQGAMDGKYEEVKKIDASSRIGPERKADAWSRFLSALEERDNPFSTADNQMASYARHRAAHWRSAAADDAAASSRTESTAAITRPTGPREAGRDGPFIAYDDKTVLDTRTGLMWAARDNGQDIDWHGAKKYCESYNGGGYTDWRMPTLDELEGIYDAAESGYPPDCSNGTWKVNLTELIRLSCCCPWASEIKSDGSSAAYFYFYFGGGRRWVLPSHSYGLPRALPVRRGK